MKTKTQIENTNRKATSAKHRMKLLAFALVTIAVVKAHSQVNLEKGSFHLNATDFGVLERNYSSRSVHEGFFGFGWCSPLDFTVKSLCDYKENPFPKLKPRFDHLGRIESWSEENKRVNIKYDGPRSSRPNQIETQNLTYRITWNDEQTLILRISRSPLHAIDYQYKHGNLLKFSGLRPAEMKYDENHNLIELVSSKAALKIKYNTLQDVVSEIRGLGPCFESYAYTAQDAGGLQFKSEVFEVCSDKKVMKARLDFTYNKNKSGNLELQNVTQWSPSKVNVRNAAN